MLFIWYYYYSYYYDNWHESLERSDHLLFVLMLSLQTVKYHLVCTSLLHYFSHKRYCVT